MEGAIFHRRLNQRALLRGPTAAGWALLLTASLLTFVPAGHGAGKDWPTKPITLVVPWTAGGGTDRAARFLAPRWSKTLGVPILVVNKPGASGITAPPCFSPTH